MGKEERIVIEGCVSSLIRIDLMNIFLICNNKFESVLDDIYAE